MTASMKPLCKSQREIVGNPVRLPAQQTRNWHDYEGLILNLVPLFIDVSHYPSSWTKCYSKSGTAQIATANGYLREDNIIY